ncbi:hypothetical protein JRQ81_010413 [Phrynocephalus forsythii]|uniref:Fork-head domain-containing protein n=1 Tax=Phrynocephalus forsythii TaxID=171643 RepID=A0A9Q0X9E7_9SAUR|nr:hypothetical protein JRQ81_010413 [Phrynocephalus forsythii]
MAAPEPLAQPEERQPNPQPWRGGAGNRAVDDSLTNLQWLQGFSILTDGPEKPSASAPPEAPAGFGCPRQPPRRGHGLHGDSPATGKPAPSDTPSLCLLPLAPTPVDYRTDRQGKPPSSYATLISMSMRDSPQPRLSLSAICAWIMENFGYYRHTHPSWQNAIHHNLSLNKCFRKVPRQEGVWRGGGFWQVAPQDAGPCAEGVFQRRRLLAPPSASTQPGAALPEQGPPTSGTDPQGASRSRGSASSPPQAAEGPGRHNPLLRTRPVQSGLELTTALGSLAGLEEEAGLASLSKEGTPYAAGATLAGEGELPLCPEPCGEGAAEEEEKEEAVLGPPWAFEEEGACFGEGLLAKIQCWEA